jgi:hypothetical protein
VNKLESIPLKYPIGLCVLLLLYMVIINVEKQLGSQRYYLTATVKTQSSNETAQTETTALQCVDKDKAIELEVTFERMPDLERVERRRMHVFSKWINCGVL